VRFIHWNEHTVDTAIVTRQAITANNKRCWALRTLCSELLDRDIQTHGSKGHDCLKDTFAAREVLLFCLRGCQKLEQRAQKKRIEVDPQPKHLRQSGKSQKNPGQARLKKRKGKCSENLFGAKPVDREDILHWSDIAEDLGWPHPETGYDPWSG
jgi:hypothetical protein